MIANDGLFTGSVRIVNDLIADTLSGDGAGITNLNATNIASGTLSADRLATSGVTAGSYGPTANVNGSNGATINVPQITVDSKGRVTSVVNRVYTAVNTNTTYSNMTGATTSAAGTAGLVPAPAAGAATRYLRSDGTWQVPPDNNTTYTTFVKSGASAASGLVPAPSTTAGTTKYLREDGTWQVPPNTNTTYSAGTGISLSGTTFSNSGVRSIATGSTNGTISVNTNGTSADVAVKGLGSAAYTASSAYAAASHNHSAANITSGTLPVARGGTGATDAATARTNLGITPANIGAATSSHNHDSVYVKKAGDTMTGPITNATTAGGPWLTGKTGTPKILDLTTASVTDGSRYDPLVRGFTTDNNYWNFGLGANGRIGFYGFKSTRTTNGTDWSVDINVANGLLYSTAGFSGPGSNLTSLDASNIAFGTLSADRLATSGVTAGSYGPTANVSGSNGTTINVPQITVDSKGRVTSVVNRVYTSVNTDTNTTYSAATQSAQGLMSAADKTKLDGIATGANAYSLPLATSSVRGGVKIGYTQSGKNYPVQLSNEQMYVNVPWTDTNTTYTTFVKSGTGAAAGLVPAPSTTAGTTKYLREDGTWQVPPDTNTNTTYSAGTGIGLSGTTFSNAGVRSITTGTTNGTISVNTNGTSANVAVKGLGSAAYTASTAYAAASHNHSAADITSGTLAVARGGTGQTTIADAAKAMSDALVVTITKSLKPTTDWIDTGIVMNNISSDSIGTFAVQVTNNTPASNGSMYSMISSGIMSVYNGNTNSTEADEIEMHQAGHASNGNHVYLRTVRVGGSTSPAKLQIAQKVAASAASTYTFKFKRII